MLPKEIAILESRPYVCETWGQNLMRLLFATSPYPAPSVIKFIIFLLCASSMTSLIYR